jgi:hypothetical protein
MTETLHLTIVYEDGGDGLIVASIAQGPRGAQPGSYPPGGARERDRCAPRRPAVALRRARSLRACFRQRAAGADNRGVSVLAPTASGVRLR